MKQSTMKYFFNILFLILSFFITLIIFTNAGETSSLKLSPGWPSDLNKFDVGNFTSTAVGFSNDSLNEKMVFIAQRKKNAYKDCILAFDPNEGKRFLQGCYIDFDSTEGKLRHLKRKFKL